MPSSLGSLILCVTLLLETPATKPAAELRGMVLTTIEGQTVTLVDPAAKATAVVVLATECPIANKSIPKLNFLRRSFAKWETNLFGVISDPRVSRQQARDWARQRGVSFPVIFDASGELAEALQPKATPHAFVIDRAGRIVYSGRIDDENPALGRERHAAGSYDLASAVTDVAKGAAVRVPVTETIGCLYEAWDDRALTGRVTFARDIAPIIYNNCMTCHRAGEVAPFALSSYEDVSKRARMIAAVTESRYMPPWKPKPGFGRFAGERRLSDRQIELIAQWARDGAPMGDPGDLPQVPQFSSVWRLGEPDLILKMPEPFPIPAAGQDIYRAFVLPTGLTEDRHVAAVEFRPGAPTVVHHAIFYLDTRGVARRKSGADGLPGYHSFGGPGFLPSGALGGWTPGSQPERLPEGIGRPIPRGSDLVLQVHYHPDGIERSDQSTVAIYFQKEPVPRRVATIPLVNRDIDIPPGEANYIRTAQFRLPIDTTIIGIMPHMHLLGRSMVVTANRPDGRIEPLIHIDDWDFRWQDQYRFAEPIELPAGTVLHMTARFDNSAGNPSNPNNPPRRVTRGEQTTDEMCMCFIEYVADTPADIRTIRRALIVQKLTERAGERDAD